MSAAEEPRRSVRATKGQHKALEQELAVESPKRRGRKRKNAEEEKQESSEEEVIRCVCGATEQDEGSEEPWIACDRCGVWQHNVCMGMSVFTEDLDAEYYCEQCKPQNHKELLAAMKRGEAPWEERRRLYEEEQVQKKKRGPKKGKGKRLSGGDKDDGSQTNTKAKPSPAPETKKDVKGAAGTKRKSRGPSQDDEVEDEAPQKMRKVAETQAVVAVPYDPPADLPERISELAHGRQGPAKALLKPLVHAIGLAQKNGLPASGGDDAGSSETVNERAERLALQIERAVHDTYPNQSKYASQLRTLAYNLKSNNELYARIVNHTLTPPMLAAMTSDELASKELQREKAEMKARSDKQAILVTDNGPRVRRTHKGEEVVGDDNFAMPSDETPSVLRRPSVRGEPQATDTAVPAGGGGSAGRADYDDDDGGAVTALSANGGGEDGHDEVELPEHLEITQTQDAPRDGQTHSPKTEFDINKVFSSVKSPTTTTTTTTTTGTTNAAAATTENRRQSAVAAVGPGPGVDADIDRMLQDDRDESPPYSPSEETDPDVIWRGNVVMASVGNLYATAKHAGGANLQTSLGLPWNTLLPKRLNVAGRIDPQKAIEYLCSLRYSPVTDMVVVNLLPATETARGQFKALCDYFTAKKRYGVVGERGLANVRDTYLVPVPAGRGNYPEFMLNLVDNFVPEARPDPMLLLVLVYRNTPDAVEPALHESRQGGSAAPTQPAAFAAGPNQRSLSVSAPAFSPTSPQGAFPAELASRGSQPPPTAAAVLQPGTAASQRSIGNSFTSPQDPARAAAQQAAEAAAREILGPLQSAPNVRFLLPQAYQMTRQEWQLIRRIFERDERSRSDIVYLGTLIAKEAEKGATAISTADAPSAPVGPHSRTPIPPPTIPPQAAAIRKQTPIPPPPIPSQAAALPPAP